MTAYQGPGKYDDLATMVRERANARTVLVMVFGGDKGDGFSFQGDFLAMHLIPDILEQVAGDIREAQKGGRG